jgi:C4-dicarboxylate-specific signal transduction histidine kinase
MFVIALVGIATGWLLTRRLDHLRLAADHMARGDLSVRTALKGSSEIADLSRSFDAMAGRVEQVQTELRQTNADLEHRVEQRTTDLAASNKRLREALTTLEQAKDELVNREKLAGLGALVAGIAHELNTPIGNCLTVASSIDSEVADLIGSKPSMAQHAPRMAENLSHLRDGTSLMVRNLSRAAHLISSFKQVVADQTSAQRRVFDLKSSLEEILAMLSPLLPKARVHVTTDFADEVTMDSYPGPLAQVITNLVSNAMTHAFDGRAGGAISLSSRPDGPRAVLLRFSDNGTGIKR